MKYIKIIIAVISLTTLLSVGSASAVSTDDFVHEACTGVSQTVSNTGCSKTNTIQNIVKDVVNVLSFFVGILSVIMIIIAGFRYIVSGGDSNAVSAAKNTLIYAIVGLAIAILAQFLVHDVLTTTNNVQNGMLKEETSVGNSA